MMMNQQSTMPDYYPDSRGHYAYDQFGVAQFAYRPAAASSVQLPLRPTAELGLSELHHQHQPQNVNHHQQLLHAAHQHHRHSHVRQQPHHPHHNMANWQTDDDLAEYQELSNKYEPEATVCKTHGNLISLVSSANPLIGLSVLQGPLVGERQSSSVLTTEYAAADPIYQTKTAVGEE